MNFNSLSYILFLPFITTLYFIVPAKIKNLVLLIGSLFFYMNWNKVYVLLMLTSITITYFAGILIDNETRTNMRKLWLATSLLLNLLILFYFKYFNFTLSILGKTPIDIILPVGISFYTFQALGYTIDVYRKDLDAEKNFFTYALFVSFFPQLVAGPIERAPNLIKQIKTVRKFKLDNLKIGFLIIMWGMFKKVIIADRLAILVNTVYNDVYSYKGIVLVIATVAFSIQIYCDFSAYSNIAIGSAKILDIDLMKNFDAPYFSKSIAEFWRRWHISLSTWFRDYLYFPLGGNKKGKLRKYINLMIVFLVSGIWHGVGLNFIFWGFLNGFYQIISDITLESRKKFCSLLGIDRESFFHKLSRILLTFFLTTITFVFFRANSMTEAVYIAKSFFYPNLWLITDGSLLNLGLDLPECIIAIFSVIVLIVFDYINKKTNLVDLILSQSTIYKFIFYVFIILFLLIFGVYGQNYGTQDFLYFQF